jgi:Ser/Thr protein kinase RdoA (MazF antagonist)
LKMSVYESLTEQALTAILAEYSLGVFQSCARIELGHVNEKWLLETEQGQYLVKRRYASLRQPSLIQAQNALVQHLRRAGFPAPTVMRTRYGNPFLPHEGEIYEVQVYVAGNPFDAADPAHLTSSACMLGMYHNTVQGFDHRDLHLPAERYGATALSWTYKKLLANWLTSTAPRDHIALLNPMIQELGEHVQDLRIRYLKRGRVPELVIHGDYHGANLVFQGHCIVAVVDYDLANWAARAMEVAEAIIAFCTDPKLELEHIVYRGALDLALVKRFVTGYLEESLLSEAEIYALPDIIRTIWLCASLDPPLEPPLSCESAPRALPEILTLARWALVHASEIVELCLAAREAITTKALPFLE